MLYNGLWLNLYIFRMQNYSVVSDKVPKNWVSILDTPTSASNNLITPEKYNTIGTYSLWILAIGKDKMYIDKNLLKYIPKQDIKQFNLDKYSVNVEYSGTF